MEWITSIYSLSITFLGILVNTVIICSGWFLVWKYTLVKIPIVREVCGIAEKKTIHFPPEKKHPSF